MKIFCKSSTLSVDLNNKIWPCCWLLTDRSQSIYLKKLEEQNPDWNDITKNSMEVILAHDAFTKHFNTEGWESDSCDPVCIEECREIE